VAHGCWLEEVEKALEEGREGAVEVGPDEEVVALPAPLDAPAYPSGKDSLR